MAGKDASTALRTAWQRRGAVGRLLWPLSLLHRGLVAARRSLYRTGILPSMRMPVPVITVGNVIAGGAGKTPVTIAIARHLKAQGWKPGIVSRGYGRQTQDCRAVTDASTAREVGDEPLLIARATQLPVVVARQRAQAALALLAEHPEVDVILCDDGLQHLALQRDVEICVFNDEGVGNGWLLPAGPLREPWPRNVDLVLYAGRAPGGSAPQFELRRALADEAIDAGGRGVPLSALLARPVAALAGIARPEEFFAMLRARGLVLADTHALPDHSDFSDWQRTGDSTLPLLCTEKDATKLWPIEPRALAVPLLVELPQAFFEALDRILRRYHQPLVNTHE
ncbi:tetraacyldisaccharide 4'-kinase [Diaphorobacter ruginosibacter]|uniref:Tetraacyldisaccharide 4'-kinase n=1 Tax=Diaphorobacter ruginosibacter TaxID=1715720 RepID=A0A7G9RIK2_9BURK|nr:tetraacyldisaccharide 4'-kinase [Diaphorobacter ruginosibacter]QNN55427.1 tetraacyldisaccharide 4'-kinase [Diaphorobacter ruginosibacter]